MSTPATPEAQGVAESRAAAHEHAALINRHARLVDRYCKQARKHHLPKAISTSNEERAQASEDLKIDINLMDEGLTELRKLVQTFETSAFASRLEARDKLDKEQAKIKAEGTKAFAQQVLECMEDEVGKIKALLSCLPSD